MSGRTARRRLVAALIAVTAFAAACASDGEATPEPVETDATIATPSVPSSDAASTAAADTSTLTGEEICARLTRQSVAADLGLDLVTVDAGGAATPQCAYGYQVDGGGLSNVTVAAMRPEDVGGATGTEAFDAVVEINEELAGAGADVQEIAAGTDAVRITGDALHLGVLLVSDHVYTVIVPVGDADADDIDQLLSTMATTLAEH
jgi:hypothetical protein